MKDIHKAKQGIFAAILLVKIESAALMAQLVAQNVEVNTMIVMMVMD